MILDRIVATKRKTLPLIVNNYNHTFKDRINTPQPRASFYDAIAKPGLSIIGEIKKASPSKGILKENFEPTHLAKLYENHVEAISVITEEYFFMGKLEYLKEIHDTVKLPLLCKDFIIDPVQIDMAYALGASCVLLIASILTTKELREYIQYAKALHIDALVEVHTQEELEKVLETEARIIGINNRNLDNFKTDLETSLKLSQQIPKDRLVISESGIHTISDVQLLSSQRSIDGILVGESFMKSHDIATHAKELKRGYEGRN